MRAAEDIFTEVQFHQHIFVINLHKVGRKYDLFIQTHTHTHTHTHIELCRQMKPNKKSYKK